jgi:uncharacterized protein YhfF
MKSSSKEKIRTFLGEYFETLSPDRRGDLESLEYDVWNFGEDKEFSERLMRLVVEGKKRATAGLYRQGQKVPAVGSFGIILDHEGAPHCLIRYTDVIVRPFSEVDFEFAKEEGEGFKDIEDWRREHWRFFMQEDLDWNDSGLVLCKKFVLLYSK